MHVPWDSPKVHALFCPEVHVMHYEYIFLLYYFPGYNFSFTQQPLEIQNIEVYTHLIKLAQN